MTVSQDWRETLSRFSLSYVKPARRVKINMIGLPKSMVSVFLLVAGSLVAAPITIFNTGVDAQGVTLPLGSTDPHYTLIISPDPIFKGPAAFVSTIPPVYVPDSNNSAWIAPGPSNLQTDSYGVGSYTYETVFDLTGLDPTTAVLGGEFAADDIGTIFLNGQNTGITTGTGGWMSFHIFGITSGFVAGVNKLDIVVDNSGGGPSGVRVEIGGTAAPLATSTVPEPYTGALTGIALAILGGLGAFKRVYREACHQPRGRRL